MIELYDPAENELFNPANSPSPRRPLQRVPSPHPNESDSSP